MTIKGGIASGENTIALSINIGGGKSYKRIFNDVVSVAINKFALISTTLSKLLITKVSPHDVQCYIQQIKLLLNRAHVELIPGEMPFHNKYNMWLLDGYVRMLLETMDLKLIAQLLDLDSILYSIEEESFYQHNPTLIDFDIPKQIKAITLMDIDDETEIMTPVADELNAYLHSLNHNLILLTSLIISNKPALLLIHKKIVEVASNHLA